jgi:hypothetical protein
VPVVAVLSGVSRGVPGIRGMTVGEDITDGPEVAEAVGEEVNVFASIEGAMEGKSVCVGTTCPPKIAPRAKRRKSVVPIRKNTTKIMTSPETIPGVEVRSGLSAINTCGYWNPILYPSQLRIHTTILRLFLWRGSAISDRGHYTIILSKTRSHPLRILESNPRAQRQECLLPAAVVI